MYLIAGLGNPGDKYNLTRHNVGFLVIDQIIKNLSVCNNINNPNFKSIVIKSSSTLYAKPQTYMNKSGEAISSIARNIINPIGFKKLCPKLDIFSLIQKIDFS